MVSDDTKPKGGYHLPDTRTRIESELDVKTYLQNLRYALKQGAEVTVQTERRVDQGRDHHYTNRYTVADLYPDEDPVSALKRELRLLTVEEYIRTVKDIRFPKKVRCANLEEYMMGKGMST